MKKPINYPINVPSRTLLKDRDDLHFKEIRFFCNKETHEKVEEYAKLVSRKLGFKVKTTQAMLYMIANASVDFERGDE